MRFSEHKEKWNECERCPLHKVRDKVVLAKGKIPCDILFVGESPGESENAVGSPFKGRAGMLLDVIVSDAVKLVAARPKSCSTRMAFTNILACIPLGDGEKRDPARNEIMACAPRLREMYKMAKPKAVVCLGELAAEWVQKLLTHGSSEPRVLNLPHPSRILRMSGHMVGDSVVLTPVQRVMVRQSTVRLANVISWVSE